VVARLRAGLELLHIHALGLQFLEDLGDGLVLEDLDDVDALLDDSAVLQLLLAVDLVGKEVLDAGLAQVGLLGVGVGEELVGLLVARARAHDEAREAVGLVVLLVEVFAELAAGAADAGPERFEAGERLDDLVELLAREDVLVAETEQVHVLGAELEEDAVQFRVVVHVLLALLALDAVEGRLGDVDVAGLDQAGHLAVEEGKEQRADVRTVDVRVRHDDQLVVAALGDVESAVALVLANAGAAGGDDGADFLVGEDLVDAGLLDVEDLALDRQDCLVAAVAALLGGATGGVAFDDVELADGRVALRAVGQLAGEAAGGHGRLADRLAGLTGGLAGAGGVEALVHDAAAGLRVALEVVLQLFADDGRHDAFDLGVRQAGLVLRLELGVGVLDRDHRDQAFAHVVAVQLGVLVLDEVVGLGVVVHHARQGGTEAGKVGAALGLVDEVRVAEHHLVVAVVVLQGHVHGHAALAGLGLLALGHDARVREVGEVDLGRHEDRLLEEALLVGVEEGDVLGNAFLELELVGAVRAVVLHLDRDARNEESEFAHAAHEGVILELLRGDEDLGVRVEGDLRAGALGLADHLDGLGDLAAAELHLVHLAFAANLGDEAVGERVDALGADAVETAGHLVGAFVELAAGVQVGQHELERGDLLLRVHRDGDATAVVLDGQRSVRMDLDLDAPTIAGEGLVDRVVDDFVHAVVQAGLVRIADVHTGALADRLQSLQALDVGRAVFFLAGVLAAVRAFLGIFAHVLGNKMGVETRLEAGLRYPVFHRPACNRKRGVNECFTFNRTAYLSTPYKNL